MPESTSASIRHILSIFQRQFTISFNKEDVNNIQDTARMLGVDSGLSEVVVKKYQSIEDGAMKDLFFMTCHKDLRTFEVTDLEFGNEQVKEQIVENKCDKPEKCLQIKKLTMDEYEEFDNHREEDDDWNNKLLVLEEQSVFKTYLEFGNEKVKEQIGEIKFDEPEKCLQIKRQTKDEYEEFDKQLLQEQSVSNTEKNSIHKKDNEYIIDGSEESKKIKEGLNKKLLMRNMVIAEPGKVRLFARGGVGQRKDILRQFPGLIFDDQKTRFSICVHCCEVFFGGTYHKVLKHECHLQSILLKDKAIEDIEIRSKFHDRIYLKQFYTEINVDTIRCNECACELQKIAQLKTHLRKVHGINPSNHMCPECGNRYASNMMVRQHQVEKHNRVDLANFSCEYCDHMFAEKCLLTTHHKLFHTDDRPHICDVCAQGFKRKPHLDRHNLIHSGERKYPCRHCDMAFSTSWTRTQHERRHLGIKPYKCEECDKHFGQKTSLDSHNKIYHLNKYLLEKKEGCSIK